MTEFLNTAVILDPLAGEGRISRLCTSYFCIKSCDIKIGILSFRYTTLQDDIKALNLVQKY